MTVSQTSITISTSGRGFINITGHVNDIVKNSSISTGLCHIFIHHTSASIVLCENADPAVQKDLESFMQRTAPDGHPDYQHTAEGPDDMSAHIRAMLTQSFLVIPITTHQLALGTWQGIYLWEHRMNRFDRHLTITVMS